MSERLGNLNLRYALTPSNEIHSSLRRYPHVLTTRLKRVEKGLSWSWRRWNDENGDQRVGDGEIGHALRRMQTASWIAAIIRRDDRAD